MTRTRVASLTGNRTVTTLVSLALHLAVIAAIWLLIPSGVKTLDPKPERLAIPSDLVDSVRQEVERKQLQELALKLSELRTLQNSISEIRQARETRWKITAAALREFAPTAAGIASQNADKAAWEITQILAAEQSAWSEYVNRLDAPLDEASIRAAAAALQKQNLDLRVAFAGLREQRQILHDKVLLGSEDPANETESHDAFTKAIDAAFASLDKRDAAFGAHSAALRRFRISTKRVADTEPLHTKASEGFVWLTGEIARLKGELDQRKAATAEAAKALTAEPNNPQLQKVAADSDRRLHELTRTVDRRMKDFESAKGNAGRRKAAFDEASAELAEAGKQMRALFAALESARTEAVAAAHQFAPPPAAPHPTEPLP